MSKEVSIEKTLTLFSEPFWTCNQIEKLERLLPGEKTLQFHVGQKYYCYCWFWLGQLTIFCHASFSVEDLNFD